jgi:zinc protease
MLFLSLLPALSAAPAIEYVGFTLDNGLQVYLIEDHTLPQVVVDTWYHVGSYDDPIGASGFAHLFEHLMFLGTENVPDKQFDIVMEAAGGSNNASTGDDYTNYYDFGPANLLDLLLVLESDRMGGLAITQEKLDSEREVVRNERRQNWEDPPYAEIWTVLPQMLYPEGHLYRRNGIGTHEELMAATLDTVTGFYGDWYAPNNAALVVAGDFDPAATEARIRELFGPIPTAEIPAHAAYPEVTGPAVSRRTITDEVQLPAVVMAWHSPAIFEPGDADLDILADMLGGSDDARLTKRLVLEEQTVQDLAVFQYSQQRGSTFVVMAYATPGADLDAIEAAVHEEIAAAVGEERPVSGEELAVTVMGREMDFLYGLESLMGRAENLQSYVFFTGEPDYLARDLARYKAVDADSLSAAVETWLAPEKAAVLWVLPEGGEEEGE